MGQKVNRTLSVEAVDGMVRFDLGDGTHVDLMPDQANKFAGLTVRAVQEAVFNDRPKKMTVTFNFEN